METNTTIAEERELEIYSIGENLVYANDRDPIIQNKPPRRKKKQNKIENISATCKFNTHEFLSYLAEILLDTKDAVKPVEPTHRYLGIVGLIDNKTAERVYHMFPTDEHQYHKDEEKLQDFYKNQSELTFKDNDTVQTICPRSLSRCAQKHFLDFKWKSNGNIFVTPPCQDKWIMYSKFNRLHNKEVLRLFNYLKFLMHNK